MSDQDDMLTDFYAQVFDAFAGAGLAYAASYRATDAAAVIPCTVLMDTDLATVGDFARAAVARPELGLRKSEVGTPVEGAIVTMQKTGFRYVLESRASEDEAFARWVVGRAP